MYGVQRCTDARKEVNGAKRWIAIGSIQFQPSEIAKVAVIVMLASYIVRNRKKFNQLKYLLILSRTLLYKERIASHKNKSQYNKQ